MGLAENLRKWGSVAGLSLAAAFSLPTESQARDFFSHNFRSGEISCQPVSEEESVRFARLRGDYPSRFYPSFNSANPPVDSFTFLQVEGEQTADDELITDIFSGFLGVDNKKGSQTGIDIGGNFFYGGLNLTEFVDQDLLVCINDFNAEEFTPQNGLTVLRDFRNGRPVRFEVNGYGVDELGVFLVDGSDDLVRAGWAEIVPTSDGLLYQTKGIITVSGGARASFGTHTQFLDGTDIFTEFETQAFASASFNGSVLLENREIPFRESGASRTFLDLDVRLHTFEQTTADWYALLPDMVESSDKLFRFGGGVSIRERSSLDAHYILQGGAGIIVLDGPRPYLELLYRHSFDFEESERTERDLLPYLIAIGETPHIRFGIKGGWLQRTVETSYERDTSNLEVGVQGRGTQIEDSVQPEDNPFDINDDDTSIQRSNRTTEHDFEAVAQLFVTLFSSDRFEITPGIQVGRNGDTLSRFSLTGFGALPMGGGYSLGAVGQFSLETVLEDNLAAAPQSDDFSFAIYYAPERAFSDLARFQENHLAYFLTQEHRDKQLAEDRLNLFSRYDLVRLGFARTEDTFSKIDRNVADIVISLSENYLSLQGEWGDDFDVIIGRSAFAYEGKGELGVTYSRILDKSPGLVTPETEKLGVSLGIDTTKHFPWEGYMEVGIQDPEDLSVGVQMEIKNEVDVISNRIGEEIGGFFPYTRHQIDQGWQRFTRVTRLRDLFNYFLD